MSKPTLYIIAGSANSHGALTLNAEAKLDYEIKPLDVMQGETRTPEFLAKNPYHGCPTLGDGDFHLWESNAILRYMADSNKLTDWYPTDLKTRAKVDQFLDFRQSTYYTHVSKSTYKHLGFGAGGGSDAPASARECLEGIAKHYLSAGKFIGGQEKPTIADLSFRPTLKLFLAIPGGFEFPSAIKEYIARFDKACPSYLNVWKPLEGYLAFLKGQQADEKKEDGLTLYYWPARGAMEPTRSMLALDNKLPGAGYTDHRAPWEIDLGSMNCGRVPLMKHNGEYIGQTAAIERYVAQVSGCFGVNDIEAAKIDSISQTVKEMKGAYLRLASYPGPHAEKDEKKRKELLDTWFDTPAPEGTKKEDMAKRMVRWWLRNIEAVVGGDGFAVGNKLSMADALLYNVLGEFDPLADDVDASAYVFGNKARTDQLVAEYPKVAKIVANFAAAPGVKKYLETRGKQ